MIPQEIERKFLVHRARCPIPGTGIPMRQGYISSSPGCVVRIRRQGPEARLTIKSRPRGITREEFEYPIPPAHADWMLDHLALSLCVEKTRYHIDHGNHRWEVDLFAAENHGLVLAELELESEDAPFERPPWIGPEVTEDRRFTNHSLSASPWPQWGPTAFPEFT